MVWLQCNFHGVHQGVIPVIHIVYIKGEIKHACSDWWQLYSLQQW